MTGAAFVDVDATFPHIAQAIELLINDANIIRSNESTCHLLGMHTSGNICGLDQLLFCR